MKNTFVAVLSKQSDERKTYLETDGNALITQMMEQIGNPDAEVREQLNYRLFIECLSEQLFTQEQMKTMTLTLHGEDYLYANIGNRKSDTVFTRSYSALWLSHLLNADRQLGFLSEAEAKTVLEACSTYLTKEQDIRGFVEGKGWAHSVANGADLACAIITHPHFEMKLAPILLQGVKESFWKDVVFIDDEEERLVSIIDKLIDRELPEELFVEWLEQIFDKLQLHMMEVGYTPQYFHARTNTLHFMKQLYFTLKFSRKMPELQSIVSLFISQWGK